MRNLLLISGFCLFGLIASAQNGNIGFGTLNPDSSAMLDISSNNKGILIPRMTSNERKDISRPAKGLMVFDSTLSSFWYFNGTDWQPVVPEHANILYSQLDQTGIAGKAETVISSFQIAANTLKKPGESVEIHAFGENLADSAAIRVKIGVHHIEFRTRQAGRWDARLYLYYKTSTEIKISSLFCINESSQSNMLSGSFDFSEITGIQISAEQSTALINGVGMDGVVARLNN